ncbi:MAG: dihydroorotase [Gammaproteobacteria bacterium]|nr:dihydroorotase [Gammaproteobacteria bacterium]NDG86944.1 dihydroorotase [Gammaproteobacteria bacterium]
MDHLSLSRPDDWHVHLRDGDAMAAIVGATARQFGRALVMPNLQPPITRVQEALSYRARILAGLNQEHPFNPLMALYLTEGTPKEEIARVAETPEVIGFKLYPQGATTHSEAGIRSLEALDPLLEALAHYQVPLMVHGEVTDSDIDIFDREALFIERYLEPMSQRFRSLRIVLEHISTREGVEFVERATGPIAGTLTAHHLLLNRNAMLVGGIQPHHYCLPVLKRETHRQALLAAATKGHPRFFLGTDSAPHLRSHKESSCGCAGCYTAHHAIELYATAFDQVGALDQLEGFASHHGADFYGLPRNTETIRLQRVPTQIPDALPFGEETVIPFMAGQTLPWTMTEAE